MATEKTEVVVTKAPEREKFSMEFVGRRISKREFKRMLVGTTCPEARRVLKNVFLGEEKLSFRRGGRKQDRVKKMFDAKNKQPRVEETA